jgi:hypothetical protein
MAAFLGWRHRKAFTLLDKPAVAFTLLDKPAVAPAFTLLDKPAVAPINSTAAKH